MRGLGWGGAFRAECAAPHAWASPGRHVQRTEYALRRNVWREVMPRMYTQIKDKVPAKLLT